MAHKYINEFGSSIELGGKPYICTILFIHVFRFLMLLEKYFWRNLKKIMPSDNKLRAN